MRRNVKPNIKPELLSVAIEDAKKILPDLETIFKGIENISDDNLRLLTVKAHAIKSVFAHLGETSLSQTAYELEKAGKSGDKGTIKEKMPGLIEAIKAFIGK